MKEDQKLPNKFRKTRGFMADYTNATVWAWQVQKGIGYWMKGVVVSHTNEARNIWRFQVQLDEDGDLVEIRTDLNTTTQEFNLVKRRDASAAFSARGIKDMISLKNLNEPEMLSCIEQRFKENLIYTNIGPIIIAANPFKDLPLYGPEQIRRYCQGDPNEFDPHVYALASSAYRKMLVDADSEQRENQSILVNGESGAGMCIIVDISLSNS
jgi:myosin heavy subunit